jgi:hypothetical protein
MWITSKLNLKEKISTYKRVFGSKEGKIVLFDLMNRFHILNTHKGDAYAEGQRSVVLEILNKTNVNMEALDELMKGE